MSVPFMVTVRRVGGSRVIPVTVMDLKEGSRFVVRYEKTRNGYTMTLEAVE